MHTENSVDIRGDIGRVWDLASEVERWPAILPHYRYVRVLGREGARRTLVMAARRGWIPVRWRAVYEPLPAERRLRFRHISSAARDMEVEWRIVQHDGFVRATIVHDLRSPYALIRSRVGAYLLGHQFIEYIAGSTLRRIKDLAEAEARDGRGLSRP